MYKVNFFLTIFLFSFISSPIQAAEEPFAILDDIMALSEFPKSSLLKRDLDSIQLPPAVPCQTQPTRNTIAQPMAAYPYAPANGLFVVNQQTKQPKPSALDHAPQQDRNIALLIGLQSQPTRAFADAPAPRDSLPPKPVTKRIYKNRYGCPTCGSEFYSPAALNAHIRIHTNEKPFPCDLASCLKKFRTKGQLKRHTRTHTFEQPFPCSKCDKSFSESGNRNRHLLTHSDEQSFTCGECDQSFKTPDYLQKHAKIHKK